MSIDPIGANKFRRPIESLGKTVLPTAHNTPEVESMADRIALIARGRIAKLDTLQNLNKIKPKDWKAGEKRFVPVAVVIFLWSGCLSSCRNAD